MDMSGISLSKYRKEGVDIFEEKIKLLIKIVLMDISLAIGDKNSKKLKKTYDQLY